MQKEPNRPRRKTRVRAKSNPDREPFSRDVRSLGRIVGALRNLDCTTQVRILRATCVLVGLDPARIGQTS